MTWKTVEMSFEVKKISNLDFKKVKLNKWLLFNVQMVKSCPTPEHDTTTYTVGALFDLPTYCLLNAWITELLLHHWRVCCIDISGNRKSVVGKPTPPPCNALWAPLLWNMQGQMNVVTHCISDRMMTNGSGFNGWQLLQFTSQKVPTLYNCHVPNYPLVTLCCHTPMSIQYSRQPQWVLWRKFNIFRPSIYHQSQLTEAGISGKQHAEIHWVKAFFSHWAFWV